jgi:hypothetical protein
VCIKTTINYVRAQLDMVIDVIEIVVVVVGGDDVDVDIAGVERTRAGATAAVSGSNAGAAVVPRPP